MRGPVSVLFSEPIPHENAFVDMLAGSLPDDTEVRGFSWRYALTSRYDIFHLHWPESLLRADGRLRGAVKLGLATLLYLRWCLTGTRLVWTMHNPAPHEPLGPVRRALYDRILARVEAHVVLHADGDPSHIVIPHGDYRPRYPLSAAPRRRPAEILFFGLVRPYKGIDGLISAFAGAALPDAVLRIRGKASDTGYGDRIGALASAHDTVLADLRFAPDAELPDLFAASTVVVLPYEHLFNSGVLLLALSLSRPVLAPDSPAARDVQARVGSEWVYLFDAPLSSADLAMALERARRLSPEAAPDLSYFSWDVVGRRYAAVYRCVAADHPATTAITEARHD